MSNRESLIAAIKQGDGETVSTLLNTEADLANARTDKGLSVVLLAAYYGQADIARMIVTHGAQLNLFEAATVGQIKIVQSLVEADPEQVNAYAPDGFYPLGLAAYFGHLEVVRYLLDHGADVHQVANNAQRVNALHAASANRHLSICGLLIEHGINVNATQQGGFTALQAAAQNGQLELVELLLKHGAQINARNEAGQTALDLARSHDHTQVAAYLEQVSTS